MTVEWADIIQAVMEGFLGAPNKALSKKDDLRWGNQGSVSLDLTKSVYFDYEANVGGGVLDFVMQQLGCDKTGAVEYLENEGYIAPREEKPRKVEDGGKLRVVETYEYQNDSGEVIYASCRCQWQLPSGEWRQGSKGKPDKTFIQKRRLADGTWAWGLKGGEFMRFPGQDWRKFDQDKFVPGMDTQMIEGDVEHGLYHLPQLKAAVAAGKPVLIVEGERKVHAAESLGYAATCNSGGAKKFDDSLVQHFVGAFVVILADNDQAGIDHANVVARKLQPVAASVRVAILPGLQRKEDIVDWVAHGGTRERLTAFLETVQVWRPIMPKSKFGATTLRSLSGSAVIYDWLIKGLVERGGTFLVAGAKQTGKSFFSMELGMAVARGIDFLGRKTKKGLVIFIACEDSAGVKLRAEGYRRDRAIPESEDIPFVIMDQNFSLMTDDHFDAFTAECLSWADYYGTKIELIVIDTFSRATEGLDEINSAEVGRVLGRVNKLVAATGATVGLVHHMNAAGERVRGHSSLTANIGQVIEIRQRYKPRKNRNDEPEKLKDDSGRPVREVLLEKNKNGQNDLKWQYVLRKIDMGRDADDYEISTCVIEWTDLPADEAKKATADALGGHQRLVMDALHRAIANAPEHAPEGTVVKQSVFFKECWRVWPFTAPEAEIEKRKTELARAIGPVVTALMNKGRIGRDNDRRIIWAIHRPREVLPNPTEQAMADVEVPF